MTFFERLKSRKFIESIVVIIGGLVALFWGAEAGETTMIIAGSVVALLAALGYVHEERKLDEVREMAKQNQVQQEEK